MLPYEDEIGSVEGLLTGSTPLNGNNRGNSAGAQSGFGSMALAAVWEAEGQPRLRHR
jgi:hypothetical protein